VRYDTLTQAIHWLSLAAVAAALATGWSLEDMPRGTLKLAAINLHASFGVLILALTVVRLAWQIVTPAPEPPPGQPMLRIAAKAMHLALYALLVLVPLSGLLMMAAKGRSVEVFGFFVFPPLVTPDPAWGHMLEEVHETLPNLMLLLVGLHAAAAVFHQAVLGDGTLSRMFSFGAARTQAGRQ
jgi:cytochrome b561